MQNLNNILSEWISPEFWSRLAQATVTWLASSVPAVLAVLAVGWLANRALTFACGQLGKYLEAADTGGDEDSKHAHTLVSIVRRAGRVAIGVMVLLLVLTQLGIDIGPLLASAGVVGLAIGFGAQELVKDFFFGFFLLLEGHIRLGDVAIINGTGGLVEKMGMRTTVLRDLAGVVHVFRNGNINSLSNMTKEWSAMVFDIGVAYKEDTDAVSKVMKEVAEQLKKDSELGPKILEPIEIFGLDAFGDSAVVIKARLKTRPIAQWEVGREYRRRLKKAFDQRGIEIPFPHRTLYWGEASPPFKVLSAAE